MNIIYERTEYFSQADFLYELCCEENDNRELLNLIIIDVVTSLEVYVERLLKQFVKSFNRIGLKTCKLHPKIRLEHSKKVIKQLNELLNHGHKNEESSTVLKKVSSIWSDGNEISIDIDVKYPRGKHGEVQLIKLFQKIGVDNVLSRINISSEAPSLLDNSSTDISSFIREITEKRNLAIHEGAPLHNHLSLVNVKRYIDLTDEILQELTRIINDEIQYHKNKLIA